ncbi:hypothetical protein DEA8626_02334 [Defluviimonas aquaemixtae]|uniref:Phospholipase C n=1 Tax=Albidovulum aquaemixtae TaxID=1542388 RepID=A0A2R8B8B1_9RHOB|nr:hypothetical protein [Defluviimonas aquaemixtae]SPH18789.1 hypothetical protein DEA8626_02334 [Defluviimonas aquaemixtae]
MQISLRMFILLLALFAEVSPASAYREGDYTAGLLTPRTHQWIIDRAIDLLRSRGRARIGRFPVQSYLPHLYWGAWYADNTEVKCIWTGFREENCDAIHHYGHIGDIVAWKTGSPKTVAANTGGFAGPFYGQVLFDQAVRFWPGGPAPDLSLLPYRDAGYIRASFLVTSVTDLGNTYVGGQAFCEKHAHLTLGSSVISIHECPKWPLWAAIDAKGKIAREESEVSLRYLGWAIHLVEDLTVPYHANNQATDTHSAYENDVHTKIENGDFDHLPILALSAGYKYSPCGLCTKGAYVFPVVDEFVSSSLSVEQLGIAARQIAIDTDSGAALLPDGKGYWQHYSIMDRKAVMERGLDAAIKLVAAVLEKHLESIALAPDAFETNDTVFTAAAVAPGYHPDLTIDTPNDIDWYAISIPADNSDLVVDLYFDPSASRPASRITSVSGPYAGVPKQMPYGSRIEMRGISKGTYRLEVQSTDLLMLSYGLHVFVGIGTLPADQYEDNDTPASAARFYDGCDFTGDLTIDAAGDDDCYYVRSDIGLRIDARVILDGTASLSMSLDEHPAAVSVNADGSRQLSLSRCTQSGKPLIAISGSPTRYSMCILLKSDAGCLPDLSNLDGGPFTPPQWPK